jgi:hypothetical protein
MPKSNKATAKRRTSQRDELKQIGTACDQLIELLQATNDTLIELSTAVKPKADPPAMPCSTSSSIRSENTSQLTTFDIAKENIVSFREASEMIPTHPGISTISRWCRGVRGNRLESILIGGRRKTSRQAVERFLVKCSERGFVGFGGDIDVLREHVDRIKSGGKKRTKSETKKHKN